MARPIPSSASRAIGAGAVPLIPADLVGLGRGRRRSALRVEALEFRITMEEGKVRIAPRPNGVPESRFPRFAKCVNCFRLSFQAAVDARRVIENRGLVSAQGDGQIELAHRVVRAPD